MSNTLESPIISLSSTHKINLGTDPKVVARMALGFRKAALISALDTIETTIEDLMVELAGCDNSERVDLIEDKIDSLVTDAKEIEAELDGLGDDSGTKGN